MENPSIIANLVIAGFVVINILLFLIASRTYRSESQKYTDYLLRKDHSEN
ncbi:MAG: hypothetical protein WCL14_13105 [Bacteroidota bacterium]